MINRSYLFLIINFYQHDLATPTDSLSQQYRCRRTGAYISLELFCFVNITSSCSLIPQRDRQTDRRAGRQADRQAGGQAGTEADKQTDRRAGGGGAGRQTDRQTGGRAGRQIDRYGQLIAWCLLECFSGLIYAVAW